MVHEVLRRLASRRWAGRGEKVAAQGQHGKADREDVLKERHVGSQHGRWAAIRAQGQAADAGAIPCRPDQGVRLNYLAGGESDGTRLKVEVAQFLESVRAA